MTPTSSPPVRETATGPVRDAPAFDFYPERWLVGVAGMSDAEQLAYLRLLCHQWLQQGLPEDVPALKRLGGKGVTPAVLAKLPLQADGKRRNARLEVIREEQRERIAKRSEQRRAAANKRWHSAPSTPPRTLPAAGMRPQCGSMCETDAAAMPTPHHPPPTSYHPEDANNAGSREADAAGDAAAQEAADAAADAATAAERAANEAAATRNASAEATPSLPTVQAWAAMIGCPPDKAEIWWHEHEARPLSSFGRWTDRDGNAVQRPQHALTAWWRKWQANDHQRNTRTHPTTPYHGNTRPAAVRSDSANTPGRYA